MENKNEQAVETTLVDAKKEAASEKKENVFVKTGKKIAGGVKKHWKGVAAFAAGVLVGVGTSLLSGGNSDDYDYYSADATDDSNDESSDSMSE